MLGLGSRPVTLPPGPTSCGHLGGQEARPRPDVEDVLAGTQRQRTKGGTSLLHDVGCGVSGLDAAREGLVELEGAQRVLLRLTTIVAHEADSARTHDGCAVLVRASSPSSTESIWCGRTLVRHQGLEPRTR